MKSYHQRYRVYYELIGNHNDLADPGNFYIKLTGIIFDIPNWGRVACRTYRNSNSSWKITDFQSGLIIDSVDGVASQDLEQVLRKRFANETIQRFRASRFAQERRQRATEIACQKIPFIRKWYLQQ